MCNCLLQFDTSKLLPNVAYVQLTFVEPFFTEVEKASRRTEFERRNNIQRFMYETPFTKSGKAHGDTCNQWIRKTILTGVETVAPFLSYFV